jgi:hypothetical protein
MPMMQKRHYEFIAMQMAILNDRLTKEDSSNSIRNFFQNEFLSSLAHDLKMDNPNFDTGKFMDRCKRET